jgi:hypothetical protein
VGSVTASRTNHTVTRSRPVGERTGGAMFTLPLVTRPRARGLLAQPVSEIRPISSSPCGSSSVVSSPALRAALNLGPHPYQACSSLCALRCKGARRPAQPWGACDRSCPLDTRVGRPMWHASGTAGEDQRGSELLASASARVQGEARPQRPPASLASASRARGSSPDEARELAPPSSARGSKPRAIPADEHAWCRS